LFDGSIINITVTIVTNFDIIRKVFIFLNYIIIMSENDINDIKIDTTDITISCTCCEFKPSDKKSVLNSLTQTGEYNYNTGEYTSDSGPVDDGWEVIISGNEDFMVEKDSSLHISSESLHFFCPDCVADPKIVIDHDNN